MEFTAKFGIRPDFDCCGFERQRQDETTRLHETVLVEIQLPKDWDKFSLPPALAERLQELLDRQDIEGRLSKKDRSEAKALAELVDILAVMKLAAEQATAAVKR